MVKTWLDVLQLWFSTFVTMVYQAQNSVVDHGQSDNDGFSTFVTMVLHLTMVDILMVLLNVFPSIPSNIFFWLHQIYQVNIIIYNQLVNDSYINLALNTFCDLEIDQYYKDMLCLAIISEDIILQKHRRLFNLNIVNIRGLTLILFSLQFLYHLKD